jgi:UDP-N-acetylmuramyl tripeptide synthase
MRLATATAAARAAGALSRRTGRGGTSLPGKLLLRLEPDAIGALAARLEHGSAVISATNGKTTTAAMVAKILERRGRTLVHNRAGANMAGGVASALLDGRGDTGLFEVDEFWLDRVVPQLRPRAVLLGNLFRDQLDRYGELEIIAERWARLVEQTPATALVLNADDPTVADLGRERPGAAATAPSAAGRGGASAARPVTYFGVEDTSVALPGLPHATDAKHCRRCGRPYAYDAVLLGHLGHYRCPSGDSVRPQPRVAAEDVELQGVRSARFTLRTPQGRAAVTLPLPGLYNVYNALGAAALALEMGATLDDAVAGLEAVAPAFGRAETVVVGGRELSILLVKNPAGANEVVRTLALEPGEHDLLGVLNDRTADGRDVSWVWDADFELLAPHVRRAVCAGTRAAELALRLKYAGVPEDRLHVEPDPGRALDAAVAGGEGRLFAIPTYTAMLELREELVGRGAARSSWT